MGRFRCGNNSDRHVPDKDIGAVAGLTFIDINPGLGGFGFAAENAGLLRVGPLLLTPDVRGSYLDFNGAGSLDLIDDTADIVLATLPFSMFADGAFPDPAVTEVIVACKGVVRRGGAIVFTVKWDVAERLGVAPEEYAGLVARHFPKMSVRHLVSNSADVALVDTTDLFIVVAAFDATEVWDGVSKARADHPSFNSRRLRLSAPDIDAVRPQEILQHLGFPEDFHRSAAIVHDIHDHLRESVAIPHATIILRAVSARVEGRN